MAEALALANQDPELGAWLEEHLILQLSLREKFRGIQPPSGLKEQIISEETARSRTVSRRRQVVFAAVTVLVIAITGLAVLRLRHPQVNDLATYRARMARVASSPYGMDLATNDPAQVQSYLARQHAPSDYSLPAGLKKAALAGCAVEGWKDAKVAMICFRTGRPLPLGESSDLWLFVVDRRSLKNATVSSAPEISKVRSLMIATWTAGDKIYLLGVTGDEQLLRSYL